MGDWTGVFAEYVVATDAMCHPLPDGMGFDEGAMLEPFCVGLHAVRRAALRMGESLAVLGAGTIGMMTLLSARCCAPGWVAATDPSAAKRKLALQCGADLALDPVADDPVQQIRGPRTARAWTWCSWRSPRTPFCDRRCRSSGAWATSSSSRPCFQDGWLEARQIQVRERTVIGTSMYTAEDYRPAIRLWERGRLPDFPALIAERIRLDQLPSVIAALAAGRRPDDLKVIIRFD